MRCVSIAGRGMMRIPSAVCCARSFGMRPSTTSLSFELQARTQTFGPGRLVKVLRHQRSGIPELAHESRRLNFLEIEPTTLPAVSAVPTCHPARNLPGRRSQRRSRSILRTTTFCGSRACGVRGKLAAGGGPDSRFAEFSHLFGVCTQIAQSL